MRDRVMRVIRELVPFYAKNASDSRSYWRRRYFFGGNSGVGSRGAEADFKAERLSACAKALGVARVVELGCGDGRNAALFAVPVYLGLDISPRAIALARAHVGQRAGWRFEDVDGRAPQEIVALAKTAFGGVSADLSVSFDVIYHLIEDDVYARYLDTLCALTCRYAIVYSSDNNDARFGHIRGRRFSDDLAARGLREIEVPGVAPAHWEARFLRVFEKVDAA